MYIADFPNITTAYPKAQKLSDTGHYAPSSLVVLLQYLYSKSVLTVFIYLKVVQCAFAISQRKRILVFDYNQRTVSIANRHEG